MTARELREAVIGRAVAGPGHADPAMRRAAFDNAGVDSRARRLVDKVARHAWKVTDEDLAAAKAVLPEDVIFELVVCAALGQAARQWRAATDALEAVIREGEER